MNSERWQKVKGLFDAVLEIESKKRGKFLDNACGADAELRRDVQNLLASLDDAEILTEKPVAAEAGNLPIEAKGKLNKGQSFAHYEILREIGAGGMGEVYLATDTRLDRKVALKLLTDELGKKEDYLRRFKQEARAASALNHPNIVTIYEIGEWQNSHFIAMEFVEGSNLRQLLEERKIKFDDALNIAIQTASALAAAHAAGIVHRDIKPENIMLRHDGLVRVLDFGLAKQTVPQLEASDVDATATTREHLSTMPGVILGTAVYMSPEQARGKKTDARTDIWSLGVVLYEMATNRLPFTGDTKSDVLASVLKTEPPLSFHLPNVPVEFEHIVKKALGKDPEERYQVVKDLQLDLKILQSEMKSAISASGSNSLLTASQSVRRTLLSDSRETTGFTEKSRWLFLALPVLILSLIFLVWYFRQKPGEAETNLLSSLASSQITSWKSELSESDASRARFSPDGKLVAFVASNKGKSSIWLKQIGGGEAFTRREDDSIDTSPLFSPDGGQIAYVSERGGRRGVWTAPALGGAATLLAPLDTRSRLIYWSKDGAAVYLETGQNLYALDITARQITKLTNFDESQIIERNFAFAPDGKRIVYADRRDGQKDLWAADISGANPVRLTNDAAEDGSPVWHADGQRIIYSSNRNGIKQICVAYTDGRPPVQLTFSDGDSDVADVSADGTKILYETTKDDSDLWGVRLENGKEFQITSDIGIELWEDVAPNGETIAYQASRRSSVSGKLLNCLLLSQKITGDGRQLQLASDGFNPRWSPDGSQLAFLRSEAGNNSLWITSATGGDERALTGGDIVFGGHSLLPYNRVQTQDYQWSPDNRSLIYCATRGGISNIWQAAADGAGETQLTKNEDKSSLFFNPLLSSDGGRIVWLAMSVINPRKPIWSVWISQGGKQSQIYQSDSVLRLVGWSQAERGLIIKTIEGARNESGQPAEVSLFQIALDGNASPQEIARLKAAYFLNVQLLPDRRTLAFVARQNGSDTIQIVPSTGGTTKTLISSNDARVYFSSLAIAPDGKTLYYGKQANWQVISMIDNFK